MNERKTRVLIVDDDSVIRLNLETFLDDEGFYVRSAPCAEDAMLILASDAIDVCIVDIRLPGLDGDEFIKLTKPSYTDMKYLIHTGSTEYMVADELKNIGVLEKHLIKKPVSDMVVFVDAIDLVMK